MDTIYIDHENGEYCAFTYSEGARVILMRVRELAIIYAYAHKHGYAVVEIK